MTTTVKADLVKQFGEAAAGARMRVIRDRVSIAGSQQILPDEQTFTADAGGKISMELLPNLDGSQYSIRIISPAPRNREIFQARITVPDIAEVDLVTIIDQPPQCETGPEGAGGGLPDPTGQPAGQIIDTDGDGAYRLRDLQDAVFLYGSGFRVDNVVAADNFNRSDRDLHGDQDMRGNTYTVRRLDTGVEVPGLLGINNRVMRRTGSSAGDAVALVPRPTGQIFRQIEFTVTTRNNINWVRWGWCPAYVDADNWLYVGAIDNATVGIRQSIAGIQSAPVSIVSIGSAGSSRLRVQATASFLISIGRFRNDDLPVIELSSPGVSASSARIFEHTGDADMWDLLLASTHEGPMYNTAVSDNLYHSYRAVQWQAA